MRSLFRFAQTKGAKFDFTTLDKNVVHLQRSKEIFALNVRGGYRPIPGGYNLCCALRLNNLCLERRLFLRKLRTNTLQPGTVALWSQSANIRCIGIRHIAVQHIACRQRARASRDHGLRLSVVMCKNLGIVMLWRRPSFLRAGDLDALRGHDTRPWILITRQHLQTSKNLATKIGCARPPIIIYCGAYFCSSWSLHLLLTWELSGTFLVGSAHSLFENETPRASLLFWLTAATQHLLCFYALKDEGRAPIVHWCMESR